MAVCGHFRPCEGLERLHGGGCVPRALKILAILPEGVGYGSQVPGAGDVFRVLERGMTAGVYRLPREVKQVRTVINPSCLTVWNRTAETVGTVLRGSGSSLA